MECLSGRGASSVGALGSPVLYLGVCRTLGLLEVPEGGRGDHLGMNWSSTYRLQYVQYVHKVPKYPAAHGQRSVEPPLGPLGPLNVSQGH